MAVGFAERTKTSNDYVKNFFKNSRNYKRDFPTICDRVIAVRQEWEDDYFNRKHTYTKEELLGKDYRGLDSAGEPKLAPKELSASVHRSRSYPVLNAQILLVSFTALA